MLMRWIAVPALLVAFTGLAQAAECPELLQGSLPKLRAKESIDLCQRFEGKPLVVVNRFVAQAARQGIHRPVPAV